MAFNPADLIAQQKETNRLVGEANKLLGKAVEVLVKVDVALARIAATTERSLTREGTDPPAGT